MSYRVFLSYGSVNRWIVERIKADVEATGASTFLDQADIEHGADLEAKIKGELHASDELLALINPFVVGSYSLLEIGGFLLLDKPVVVVALGVTAADFERHPNVPRWLTRGRIVALNDLPVYCERLRTRLGEPGR
jgi:hypothetical protein